jgi:Tfp pilus assembly protein PilO
MKLQMTSSNRLIAAMLAIVAIAVAFWMMMLSPKREEAKELGARVETLEASLAVHEGEVAEAEAAREEFPAQYQRLVVLGKAVPGDDEVASLLVQLNRISDAAGGTLREIKLTPASGNTEAPAAAPVVGAEGTPVSATEVAASLLPLGAAVGPAGLAVMPYEVTFDGNFREIADFIKGLDSLVNTGDDEVRVDGRLVTIDGFSLEADQEKGFPALQASFTLTTYLTPPSEGVTGGATPETPGATTVTPAATTTGGAP